MEPVFVGGIGVAAFAAGLFFFRFWRQTRDRFFLCFALAFWIEGAHRVTIYWIAGPEADPLHYLPRLLAYGLILVAIVEKNRAGTRARRKDEK
jgi:hypothetical protein